MQRTWIVTPGGEHVVSGPVRLSAHGDDLELVGARGDGRAYLTLLAVGESVSCHLMHMGAFDEDPIVTFERTEEGVTCRREGESFEVWPRMRGWGQALAFSRHRLEMLLEGNVKESWDAETLAEFGHYRAARMTEWSRDYGRHFRIESRVVETGTVPHPESAPSP